VIAGTTTTGTTCPWCRQPLIVVETVSTLRQQPGLMAPFVLVPGRKDFYCPSGCYDSRVCSGGHYEPKKGSTSGAHR